MVALVTVIAMLVPSTRKLVVKKLFPILAKAVAGLRDVIEQERARRQTYLPTPPPGATQLGYTATTARFAANAYALPGADLEQVRPLGDAYRQNAANQVTPILSQLAPPGRRLGELGQACLLYTSPSPRDRTRSRMPSSA